MSKVIYPVLISAIISMSGCASLTTPSAQSLSQVPVVKFGEAAPSDHITLYPAGASLPVLTSVKGSLFEKTDESTLNVTLKKNLYVYKQWVSFDGKSWMTGNKAITGNILMTLPGEKNGQDAGTLSAEFNLK
ncbi:MAG: hypothetical protein HOP06_00750 [Methylotenera sp.]|nr:hypothetical protein [Methylotenera sp.]